MDKLIEMTGVQLDMMRIIASFLRGDRKFSKEEQHRISKWLESAIHKWEND